MIAALPDFRQSPLFTPAEKSAIALADAMAGDYKRAPMYEIFAELRKYYTEEQIVRLGWEIGMYIGYGRLVYALNVPGIGASCAIAAKAAAG
jgi:alkylhydroperoxidase family enzyme